MPADSCLTLRGNDEPRRETANELDGLDLPLVIPAKAGIQDNRNNIDKLCKKKYLSE
jgi:hypothetical protein